MHALWTLLAFCSVVAAAVVSAVVICFQQAQMYRGFSLGQFRDQQASLVGPEADDTLRRRGWVRPRTLLVLFQRSPKCWKIRGRRGNHPLDPRTITQMTWVELPEPKLQNLSSIFWLVMYKD